MIICRLLPALVIMAAAVVGDSATWRDVRLADAQMDLVRARTEALNVIKDDSRTELFTALASVLKGKSYLSPSICDRVVAGYLAGGDKDSDQPSWEILTTREREVIKLIAEGNKTKEIAVYLSLSPKTVEKHRTNLKRKLDLHNVSAVTVYAIQNGFITQ